MRVFAQTVTYSSSFCWKHGRFVAVFKIFISRMAKINDAELRIVLSQLRRTFPQLGEKMVIGHLRSLGYNVPRSRVRNAVRVTDPINVALRWQGSLTARRPYSVPGPNSLWHIGKWQYNIVLFAT